MKLFKIWILPALVFGCILFFWQFLSFAALNLHENAQQYTPLQDSICKVLQTFNLKEGGYMLPQPQPGLSPEAWESQNAVLSQNPWIRMNYYSNRDVSMIKPLLLGFLSDLILGVIILWMLHQSSKGSKLKHIIISVGIGIIAFIYIPLTNHIWFPSFDIWAYALDAIIPFAGIGLVYSAFKIKT
jgi:hypothetical protein